MPDLGTILSIVTAVISAALGLIVALLRSANETQKEELNRRLGELDKDIVELKSEIRGLNERTHAQEKTSIGHTYQLTQTTTEVSELRKQMERRRGEIDDLRATGGYRPVPDPPGGYRQSTRSRPEETSTTPPRK